MPPLRYFIVDAFTDRPFAGNPAAVVPLPEWRNDDWLQNVAMEMNLSETAFLVREGDDYHLRWFTPKVEVALCGHATLASARGGVVHVRVAEHRTYLGGQAVTVCRGEFLAQ
jgi:PhzF family phenazine biosynthesis protein